MTPLHGKKGQVLAFLADGGRIVSLKGTSRRHVARLWRNVAEQTLNRRPDPCDADLQAVNFFTGFSSLNGATAGERVPNFD